MEFTATDHLGVPPLDSLQQVHALPVLETSTMGAVFQVESHRIEEKDLLCVDGLQKELQI